MDRRVLRGGLLTITACLIAVGPTETQAQEGMWGGELVARIDSAATAVLSGDDPITGLTIGVKRGSDLLLLKGYGSADLEHRIPATSQTVYRIGSLTKQITAAAIMQLVEAGRIDLDAEITEYLPDYNTQGETVLVRHLLNHTSGIRSYTGLSGFFESKARLDLTNDEMVALFQDEPFDFTPGDEYRYNNSAYFLLGILIETVSGLTYTEYLDTHVFDALGLTHTSYCDERSIIPGRAEGYEWSEGQFLNDQPISMNVPGAAGALCSTVGDLFTWSTALRQGRVVSEASWELMTTATDLNDGSTHSYGFGLGLGELEGRRVIIHTGGINGFTSIMAHYPESDLDIVILTNTQSGRGVGLQGVIARWVFGLPAAEQGN